MTKTKKPKPPKSFLSKTQTKPEIDWAMVAVGLKLGNFCKCETKENEGFIVGTDISAGIRLHGIRCYYYSPDGFRRLSIETHKKICEYLVALLELLPEFEKERIVTNDPRP